MVQCSFHLAKNISRSQWLRSLRFQNRHNPPLELIINYPLGVQCQLRAQNYRFLCYFDFRSVSYCKNMYMTKPSSNTSFAKCRRIQHIWCIMQGFYAFCKRFSYALTTTFQWPIILQLGTHINTLTVQTAFEKFSTMFMELNCFWLI